MVWILIIVCFLAASLASFLLFDAGSDLYRSYRRKYVSRTSAILNELYTDSSPESFLTIKVLLAVLAGLAAYLFSAGFIMPVPPVMTILAVLVGSMIPDIVLKRRQAQRRKKLNTQLIDAMGTISNGLRSGFSLMQAISLAARQLPDPIGQEFRLVNHEIELGSRTEDALQNMGRRINDRDLNLVVSSVRLTIQTGGELPIVFKRLSETIRERNRVEGKVKALTSQGSLQAIIVGLIPPALGLIVHFINPELMALMYTTVIGWILITAVVVLDLLGYYLIRKIVAVRT